jgi:hypothetical protein
MTPTTHAAERGWRSGVQSHDSVALFLDTGTAAHEIRGRGGGKLRFRTGDGRWIRVRAVRHPGTQQHYMRLRAETELRGVPGGRAPGGGGVGEARGAGRTP